MKLIRNKCNKVTIIKNTSSRQEILMKKAIDQKSIAYFLARRKIEYLIF